MREKRIGIRELKSTLSECVREIKSGRTIVVTEHGQPVARIIPEAISIRERAEALRRAGTIAWVEGACGRQSPRERFAAREPSPISSSRTASDGSSDFVLPSW
jgi:prevent-host-death family protein